MSIRGWVYVMSNKAMHGRIKIGYSMKDPALRARELDGTGVPYPFKVVYDVLVFEPRDVEQAVHAELKMHHDAKEFFLIEAETAIQTIREVLAKQEKEPLHETHFLAAALPLTSNNTSYAPSFCTVARCNEVAQSGTSFCKRHTVTEVDWG